MQNSTNQERELIKLLFRKVASEMQSGNPEDWQQRDYENLSLQIDEKTGINLSVSTLKRIANNQYANIPQKNTLNALAEFAGFKDWYDFKSNNDGPKKIQNTPSFLKKAGRAIIKSARNLFYIPLAVVALVIILLIVFNSQPLRSYSDASFSSRKNVSEGVPNTVIFDYDISMYDFDSASIQQSWDARRRASIKKEEKYSTSVYYYPGYHQAKLFIDDQMVKEIPVYITTDGWLSVIQNPKNNLIPVYVREKCIEDGRIYISPEMVKNHNIDLEANNHTTGFYYVNENVYGDSDNFTFETSVKNSLDEGGLTCQVAEISIFSEYGRHFVQIGAPGCIGGLYLKFGSEYISGQNNDLSAFGTDMNHWNKVKITVKDKIATIWLNDEEIYKSSYTNSNGRIKGIYYHFAGCGSVDFARLYNAEGELVFSEDFKSEAIEL